MFSTSQLIAALALFGSAQADVLSTAVETMNKHIEMKSSPEVGVSTPGVPVQVTIGSGTLEGRELTGTEQRHFLGIPFAAPPVDDLRWKAPVHEASWDGVLDASKFGNSCMQSSSGFTIGSEISEDCLYLNVFAPSSDLTNVPVMIFFYGGSWDSGSATCPLYLGRHVVGDSNEDVILVTANYRLNVFGFMGGESMRDDDAAGTTANWGFLDQQQAMRWVKENIAAFGGNPDNVMIFGESAGAGSVANHLTSESSYAAADGPLFHKAAMESGNPFTPWNSQNMSYAETRLSHVAQNTGCTNSTDLVTVDVVNCMRQLDSQTLLSAKHGVGGIFLDWSPVEDGVVILDQPRNRMAQGLFADNVTVLLGTNADEGSLFIDIDYDADEQAYEDYVIQILGQDLGTKVIAQYPYADYNGTEDGKVAGHGGFWATTRAVGDGIFTCPARQTSRAFAQRAGAYTYFYNHTLHLIETAEPFDPEDIDPLGVFHGSELIMVFDFEVALRTSEETALAQMTSGFWSTFALNSNPNSGDENWPAYSSDNDEVYVLATENGPTPPGPMTGLKTTNCDFWDAQYIPPWVMFGYPAF